MLTFFRKIRRTLLGSGQSRRYLLYALGEIALVVIGILIALQINNWNQRVKNTKASVVALKDLRYEFQTNRDKLASLIKYKTGMLARWDLYLDDVINYPNYDSSRIEKGLGVAANRWNPSFGVLNTLISTGKIDLIENEEIKYTMLGFKDQIQGYIEDETLHIDFVNNKLIAFENRVMPYSITFLQGFSTDQLIDPQMTQNAFKSIEYQNLLGRNRFYIQVNLNSANEILTSINTIIVELDQLLDE